MRISVAELLRFLGSLRRPVAGRRARRAAGSRAMDLYGLENRQLLSGSPIVAVLDTGLNIGDPVIHGHLWTNPNENTTIIGDNDLNGFANDVDGWNFVTGTNNTADTDPAFHGTTIAKQVLAAAASTGATDVQIMGLAAATTFPATVGGVASGNGTWTPPATTGGNGTWVETNADGSTWIWVGPGNATGPGVGQGTWTWTTTSGPAPITTGQTAPPVDTPGAGTWTFGAVTTIAAFTPNNATFTFAGGTYTSSDRRWTWTATGNPTFPPTTLGTWTYTGTGPGPGHFIAGAAGTPDEGPGNGTFVWTPGTGTTGGSWAWVEAGTGGNGNTSNDMALPSSAQVLANAINYVVTEKQVYGQNVVAIVMDVGGFNSNEPDADPTLFPLKVAIDRANNAGILLVTGAGNGTNNNDSVPDFPANFSEVLSVAAVDSTGTLGDFSNFGANTVKFGAQGVDVPTSAGNVSGSEYAAAQIAGTVAGMISVVPGTSPIAAEAAIIKSLTPSASLSGFVATGGYYTTDVNQKVQAFLNNHPPVAVIESANQLTAVGYAYDADLGTGAVMVNLVIDGVTVASNVTANLPQDVNLGANHGFSISYPVLTPGSHTVQVFVQDFPTGNFVLSAQTVVGINSPLLNLTLGGAPVANNQTVSFGNVFQSGTADEIFKITNGGNQPLTISTFTVPVGFSLIKDVARTIPAGGSDTFDVRINSLTVGTVSGALAFATNDVANSSFVINLTGNIGASFVNNLYTTLLGRSADPSGLAYWTQQIISQRMSTVQVANAFQNSTEYRTIQIQQLYSSLFGRPADSSGLNYWLGVFSSGGTIEGIRNSFLASAEYFQLQGFNTNTLVSSYYVYLFNRAVDAAGLAHWSNLLITGTPRLTVVAQLQFSQEGLNSTVQRLYLTLLGRTPDTGAVAYWSAKLAAGLGEQGLATMLLTSTEFFTKP